MMMAETKKKLISFQNDGSYLFSLVLQFLSMELCQRTVLPRLQGPFARVPVPRLRVQRYNNSANHQNFTPFFFEKYAIRTNNTLFYLYARALIYILPFCRFL